MTHTEAEIVRNIDVIHRVVSKSAGGPEPTSAELKEAAHAGLVLLGGFLGDVAKIAAALADIAVEQREHMDFLRGRGR